MNIFHYALQVKNSSVEDLWKSLERNRQQWLTSEGITAPNKCDKYPNKYGLILHEDIIDKFLAKAEKELIGDHVLENYTAFDTAIQFSSNSVMNAFKTYLHLIACPRRITIAWREFYKTLFKNFTLDYILQTLVHLNNQPDDSNSKFKVPKKILEKLTQDLGLKHKTIYRLGKKTPDMTKSMKEDRNLAVSSNESSRSSRESKVNGDIGELCYGYELNEDYFS